MSFSQLPVEIRLQIYSELLVRSAPIEFETKTIAFVPSLVRSERDGLHPSILRVSKVVHREASPIFYSGNRFEFPEVYLTRSGPPSAYIGPFLKQIGSHATLIRHMQIPVPSFFHFESEQEAIFHPVDRRNLRRIQNTCTGIQTLEFFGRPVNWEETNTVKVFDSLNECFKKIPSLEKIINFWISPHNTPRQDLQEMIRGYGWTLQLTETSFGYSTAPNVKAGVLDVLHEKERRRTEVERELERIKATWPEIYD